MRILTGVLAAGMTLAVSACGLTITGTSTFHEDRSYDVPKDGLGTLSLNLDSTHATLVGTDTTKIVVHEHLSYSKNRKPSPHHKVNGSQLTLGYSCPRGINIGFNECAVGYQIELPRSMAVQVSDDSAGLTLTGLAGNVDARTSSGGIDLTDYRGTRATLGADSGSIRIEGAGNNPTFQLNASSGAIRADRIHGGRITANVDSGSFRAAFTAPPTLVDVSVSSGSANLSLPTTTSYAIQTTVSSGGRNIDPAVHNDSASPNKIKVTADSGSINIGAAA